MYSTCFSFVGAYKKEKTILGNKLYLLTSGTCFNQESKLLVIQSILIIPSKTYLATTEWWEIRKKKKKVKNFKVRLPFLGD